MAMAKWFEEILRKLQNVKTGIQTAKHTETEMCIGTQTHTDRKIHRQNVKDRKEKRII
jgi:hypothetical protein